MNDEQTQLSDAIVRYGSTFAATADPNSDATSDWPAYDINDPTIQVLVPPEPQTEHAAAFRERHNCDFWDGRMETHAALGRRVRRDAAPASG